MHSTSLAVAEAEEALHFLSILNASNISIHSFLLASSQNEERVLMKGPAPSIVKPIVAKVPGGAPSTVGPSAVSVYMNISFAPLDPLSLSLSLGEVRSLFSELQASYKIQDTLCRVTLGVVQCSRIAPSL